MHSRGIFGAVLLAGLTVTLAADQKAFLGRWNLTSGGDSPAPYWLEVKEDGGTLTADRKSVV